MLANSEPSIKTIPNATSRGFAKQAELYLEKHYPEILPSIAPMIEALIMIKAQVYTYDKTIDTLITDKYPAAQRIQQIGGVGPLTALRSHAHRLAARVRLRAIAQR